MKFTKKASLNLSINAIVILILAITMLGLGLAFMRNIFGKATEEFQEVSGTVKKQMIDQMKESTKIVDLSRPKVELKTGDSTQIFIGFKNDGSDPEAFQIREIDASKLGKMITNDGGTLNNYKISLPNDIPPNEITLTTDAASTTSFCGLKESSGASTSVYLELKATETTVQSGDVVVIPINIKTTSNAPQGTCTFELKVDLNPGVDDEDTLGVDYHEVIELTVDIKS